MWKPRQRLQTALDRCLAIPALVLIFLLTIPLGRGQNHGSLKGVVTDQLGAAASDVLVSLYSSDRVLQTKSDKRGRFEFVDAPSGTYEFEAYLPGFQRRKIDAVRIPEEDAEVISITLLIASQPSECGRGASPDYEKLAVGQPALIGVVRNYGGSPLAGFRIRLSRVGATRVVASQSSSDNGEFQFRDVEPGQYVVRASHKGKWAAQSEIFWITRENVTRIVLDPVKRGTIILCQ
jgi:Carboxypeptidase regulatory-like domain